MAFTINLDNYTETDINYTLPHPITLKGKSEKSLHGSGYKAGLVYFSGWNNIYNVTTLNNTFVYSSDAGINYKTITFNPGMYNIKDIIDELKNNLKNNNETVETTGSTVYPFELDIFRPSSKVVLNITNGNYIVDFKKSTITEFLGFEKIMYVKGRNIAPNIPNISHIQTIHIDCDLINSNYIVKDNSTVTDRRPVIFSFPAYTEAIGSRIVKQPANPRMFDVNKDYISKINIKIYDNFGNLINFNGEKFSLEIAFEPL